MSQKPTNPDRPAARILIPDLPSDGSYSSLFDVFKTPEQIANRDADFVKAHARFLKAKGTQASALYDLIVARMRVARLMVELAALPDVCRHEQEHKLRMLALTNEAQATEAAIVLADARGRLAQALGGTKPAAEIGPDGLTVDDVESILAQFPELDGNISKISMLLRAFVREKSG